MQQMPVGRYDSISLPSGVTFRIEELERKVKLLEEAQLAKDKSQNDKLTSLETNVADIIRGKIKLPKL